MQVIFGLLLVFLIIGFSARKYTRGVRWLLIACICVMIAVITFTHYGG
ncbi:MAG TPA: hypothetical protein VHD63_08800 [Ktedonobacteraceae bacterium]|jgi:hypothetical protein|nr:hypothetical protein [Ktedonobacteraceae bacterium]